MERTADRLKLINRDMIKYLAVVPMVIGHFCSYFSNGALYSDMPFIVFFLINAALFAPPVFFFFIAEGFRYTRSRKKYAVRLFVFALINQIPFCLVNNGTLFTTEFFLNWNIIMTLFLGLLCLCIWDSGKPLVLRIAAIIAIDVVTVLICSEWMIFGIPLILGYHIFHDKPRARLIWFASVTLCMQTMYAVLSFSTLFYTAATAVIQSAFMLLAYFAVTRLYNGKKGRYPTFAKWFFYILYPLHLIFIYVVLWLW